MRLGQSGCVGRGVGERAMVEKLANDFLDAGVLNVEVGDGQVGEKVSAGFGYVPTWDAQSRGKAGVFDD